MYLKTNMLTFFFSLQFILLLNSAWFSPRFYPVWWGFTVVTLSERYKWAGKHYFSVEESVFSVFSWLLAMGRRLWALKGCGLLFDSKISPHSISKQKRWDTTKVTVKGEAQGWIKSDCWSRSQTRYLTFCSMCYPSQSWWIFILSERILSVTNQNVSQCKNRKFSLSHHQV